MKAVVDYLLTHIELIVELILGIITLIVVILKKSQAGISPLSIVMEELPRFIVAAENTEKEGKEKKLLVMSSAIARLSDLSGLSVKECFEKYSETLSEAIEDILTTPQKK